MLTILAMVVFFLRGRLSFLSEGIAEVRKADGWGVTLALCASLASLAAMAEVMRILLRAGKVRTRRRDVNALVLSANAWSTSFPGGQALATVLQFQTMRRWGAHRPVRGIGYGVVGSAGCDCHPVFGGVVFLVVACGHGRGDAVAIVAGVLGGA